MKISNISTWFAALALLLGFGFSQAQAQHVACPGVEFCITLDDNRGAEQWQSSSDGTTFTDLVGETGDSLCVTPTGDVIYRAVISSEAGCAPVFSDTIEFQLNTLVVSAGDDTRVCGGDSVTLGGAPTASGGIGGYTYTWAGPGLSNSFVSNPRAAPSETTDYVVTVVDSFGCSLSDTINVIVDPVPAAGDTTFSFVNGNQYWIVQRCIDTIRIEVWGAEGGTPFGQTNGVGGFGGFAEGDYALDPLDPGDSLLVITGSSTGFNGGGNAGTGSSFGAQGGGASEVQVQGMRIIVGGGGGGGGAAGLNAPFGGPGGNGGLPNGGAGGDDIDPTVGIHAQGGNGGAAGVGGAGGSGAIECGGTGGAGIAGQTAAQGGAGGDGGDGVLGPNCPGSATGVSGGGGGGGYAGGGGGGGGAGAGKASAGGGGGSSYVGGVLNGSGTNSATSNHTGNGQVRISWQ
ncbi:MAG: hypothetical protein AAF998_26655 [Bacteroidota bacterium]